ncbi:PAS domain S-box protein [Brevibacillus fluminis]|uniref:histidine kinase n=2 Tax=Brevibacillus fluminis TaxID=511487 RepID=A0A3M8CTE7_9BACL|nr:PAS domain S-box protein [Brevibacillus fluminis]
MGAMGEGIAKRDVYDDKAEMFRIVAENTSDTIVVVDNRGIVRYVSPSYESLTGGSVEEYLGKDAFEVVPPEEREHVRASLTLAVQTKTPVDVEYHVYHAHGYLIDVEARVKPVLDAEDNVQYVVAVARDVTKRKTAEQLLGKILENVNAAVWATDKDFTHYIYCSDTMEKLGGIPKEELWNNPIRAHDHIHPDDNEILMGEVKRKLDMGIPSRVDFRWNHYVGETRWGQMIVHPYRDKTGISERIDGIILDITDKKRAEMALEESEQRYKSLFENNLDGVFSIELKHFYFINANRSFEKIAGIKLHELTDRCFIGLIFDEDHGAVYETLLEVMQHGQPRDIECRLANMQQGERIVSITFVPIFLAGELNGIHGIIKDITKRKREERELIKSEERSKFLQQSLNRFSNDLANVMKVSELENRLLDEVRTVLQVPNASIEEVPKGQELEQTSANHILVKIGEKQHPVYLRVEMDKQLLKIEEEWLETAVHYVTILYDNLHRIEDLMKRLEVLVASNETPKWMLRLLFKLSEKERSSLSSDLHDSVLQDLIIWYRKLESLRSSTPFEIEIERELSEIEEGLLDAIHQIRITCNELRPPFLLKMGLVESLKSLFSYTRMFANYEIDFSAQELDCLLDEEQILGVYRIVQELLNNASKHSRATKITMALARIDDHLHFSYSDDGVGVDLSALEGSFQHMGIAGIEKRVLSLEGKVRFESAPERGFHVHIHFPKNQAER